MLNLTEKRALAQLISTNYINSIYMSCPNISYFTTDPITLIWILLIIINLALVIYTVSVNETFDNINSSCDSDILE